MPAFDPLDHDRSLDAYARMRAEPGLFRLGKGDRSLWLATRHEDVLALFKDKQRFARDVRRVGMQRGRDPLNRLIHNHLLNQDPPAHTRLRRLVGAAFLPEMIEAQRGAIEGVCEGLLDELAPRGEMDLIGDFSFVLPITVIGNMLGIPAADHGRLRAWSRAFVTSMRQIHRAEDAAAIAAFLRYLRQTFAERRERPGDDLLSRLLQIEDAGERLSEDELYSMVMLLIVAGHETVMNALGNAVVTLLDRPEALAALRDGDAAVAPAVEELLRFDGPVDRTGARWVLADMAFGGQRLRRGEGVIPVTSSANRDAAVFARPDELLLGRDPNPHLAFGQGIHFCVGARLARVEMGIALPALLRRLPNLRLGLERQSLKRMRGDVVRRYAQLPVRWDV